MHISQSKLTKYEWTNLEIKCEKNELDIIKMIHEGYNNIDIYTNTIQSLVDILKITDTENMCNFLYYKFFEKKINGLKKKYDLKLDIKISSKKTIKKADEIKINNGKNCENAFEYILINLCENTLKNKNKNKNAWIKYYYTLYTVSKYNIPNININILNFVNFILKLIKCSITDVLYNASKCIEYNDLLLKYKNNTLYNHQKKLFTLCKNNEAKLIFYIAPTGTGKTLSPIGLSNQYRIIFVCAARHIGLALAKNAISLEKKIAFAFDCDTENDIRLHYFSVKDCTRDSRSGGMRNIDNSNGINVEIIISDIKSYIHAMNYMCKFNSPEKILMYWDEPTISMDYKSHEIHPYIKNNWMNNKIPNIVLSSATLPKINEIPNTIDSFKKNFNSNNIYEIISYDCDKSISLLNKENYIVLPHNNCQTYDNLQICATFCDTRRTILRYFNLNEIIKFIIYCNDNKICKKQNVLDYFNTLSDINMNNIKVYYIQLLKLVYKTKWKETYEYFNTNKIQYYNSTIYLTTKDAYTLTDGPTIFLTNDVNKIAKFYIQTTNIPDFFIKNIKESIAFNNTITKKILEYEKNIDNIINKNNSKNDKFIANSETRGLQEKIILLKEQLKNINFPDKYIPNRKMHFEHWNKNDNKNIFTSNIDNQSIETIINLHDIDNIYKILLLMGIGVFMEFDNKTYIEIVKQLAEKQQLYLIIASTDYIYGTNYQFCHAYLSKDLINNTQEKLIQAMGRVGRKQIQQEYTIRLRDNTMIYKILYPEENKLEILNMNQLLTFE